MSAAPFFGIEFGSTVALSAPGNQYYCPVVSADDGLERQFGGDIEVREKIFGMPSMTIRR